MNYAPDPDAIKPTSADAIAYDRAVMEICPDAPEPVERLSYGEDRGQKLEIYAPKDASGLPVLLFFHGGAWISGHLGWLRFMAEPVLQHGVILVASGYRLAPRCRWPAQYDDVSAALALVRNRIGHFGGDPCRIVIGGHSAGGHLAALLALHDGSPDIAACMPVSAAFDLRYGDVPIESDAGRVYRYLFADRAQDVDASPLAHVAKAARPFHLMWGEQDFARVARSGERMVKALSDAGGVVSHAVLPGASHFDTHLALAAADHPWYTHLKEAFAKHKPEAATGAPA